jgi:hypothetical protein
MVIAEGGTWRWSQGPIARVEQWWCCANGSGAVACPVLHIRLWSWDVKDQCSRVLRLLQEEGHS